ncbi:hypothetical protein BWZ20_09955 [Winogradskyella sp. J14-2]|uniref:hypothetical protein n=1 Tax=Winogradskyella sp. J14-2 TaxID=1936080 RepID=UPI0009726A37|nr:hypothetical protein [Winogradskyella sp. J14-2]APY08604.1 hypothetical protein BWZ20_09955 [Winogradskyella sp. J14-2]
MKIALVQISVCVTILLLATKSVASQNEIDIISDAYEDYTHLPREVVYLHLNKSTLFVGETLGFTAYVLNKNDKKLSTTTKNLYVTIEDKNEKIIKQKMLMVDNGVASNIFEIDSLFSNNTYTIKAYTNWMRNFNENNFFVESFKVESIETYQPKDNVATTIDIDAQFLPESGHLLHGVENTIGVVIKGRNGYGLDLALGEVVDNNGTVITTFKTNQFGIGRFPLIPQYGTTYSINISHKDNVYKLQLNQTIKKQGVILSLKRFKNRFLISVITNEETLDTIKHKRYSLFLHNGDNYDLMDIYFTDQPVITKVLELDNNPGINILTLFDENNTPIAERLTFNYNGINIISSKNSPTVTKELDSVNVTLNFKAPDTLSTHNISISVLPQETQSYNRSHNIISYNYLQPYLNGPVENAKYYFTDITEKKKFELDNLLLTQGWSSYDWNIIFHNPPDINFDFEQGIILKANYVSSNINESGQPNDLMYYFDDKGFLIAEGNTKSKSYIIKNLYPEEDQTIKLTEVTNSKGLKPANLYTQFFPQKIPNFKTNFIEEIKPTFKIERDSAYSSNVIFDNSEKVEKLDEVVVKSSPWQEQLKRRAELSRGRYGKISVVSEEDEKQFFSLWNYLSFKAWLLLDPDVYGPNGPRNNLGVIDSMGMQSPGSVNFFLNDVLLVDLSILDPILIEDVDFIEINRFGLGEGMRSPRGAIKIYTKDPARAKAPKNITRTYEFPLTFNKRKKFYTPKYKYYEDDFFKEYGVIDWKPNLTLNNNGQLVFKIAQPQVPVTLFIEGITNDGTFIFEEKSISLN